MQQRGFRRVLPVLAILVAGGCGGSGGGDDDGNGGGNGTNSAPVASAVATPASGDAPLTVAFSGSGSSDSDGQVTGWTWSFGDGGSGSGENVSHTYAGAGSYTATLTVTDNDGGTDTATVAVTVSEPGTPPEAAFTSSTQSGAAPLTVHFDASDSMDDGSISSFDWDFGDGGSDSGETTSHTFEQAGEFTVTLTVTDDSGLADSATTQISVTGESYSLSGSIQVTSNVVADSDVNDPYADYASNDTAGKEQPLPNPAVVGGFASYYGTGGGIYGDDRFGESGDESDLYKVKLAAGQTLTLLVADWDEADPGRNDLDLVLYDAATYDVIDFSETTSEAESITITQAMVDASTDGEFVVHVYAWEGISNYTLSIGDAASPAGSQTASRKGDGFVPGQVIVTLAEPAATGKQHIAPARKAASLGLKHKGGAPGRPMLFVADDGNNTVQAAETSGAPASILNALRGVPNAQAREALATIALAKTLRQRDDIATADLNYIHKPLTEPTDPLYSQQWHYRQINLPQAWDASTGEDVIVAIADTGVFLDHPDLAGNIVGGYDFISDGYTSNDGDGIDPDADDPGDEATPGSSSWHGTHVAGTVAALANNARGGAGVAWNAKLMPIRVLGVGGGTSYDIQQGVLYAAGLPNDSGTVPPQPADIINLSLGCQGCYSSSEDAVYQQARDAGLIIVAAAGNANTSQTSYPAGYDGVISVSSVRADKQRAYYSNYGTTIDVAAPGGEQMYSNSEGVLSTLVDDTSGWRQGTYEFYQGTSMAAPHMAGVIALMKSVHRDLLPDEVDWLLASGSITEDIGDAGRDDYFGHGLIDARKAVEAALDLAGDDTPLPSVLTVNPTRLSLGSMGTSGEITVSRTGSSPLTVIDVTSNASWLDVTPLTTDADGLGSYQVIVDREGLTPATYQGRATFHADDGSSVFTEVTISVGTDGAEGDVGLTYVLLLDPRTNETLDQVEVFASGGTYEYLFEQVPAGKYLVIAGTDMDNDYLICDAGEACGTYPTLGQQDQVHVDRDHEGVDFLINFDTQISGQAASADESTRGISRVKMARKSL